MVVEEVEVPETIAPEIIELLKDPLIKIKSEQPIEGIASGKRSAILTEPKTGVLIRLKGCGNIDQGFPTEPLAWPPEGTSHEVRGCQYRMSVYRELYFQGRCNDILTKGGLVGANIPLGVWQYLPGDSPAEK